MENQLALSAFCLRHHSIQMDSSLPRPALEPPKEEEEEAGAAIEAARALCSSHEHILCQESARKIKDSETNLG